MKRIGSALLLAVIALAISPAAWAQAEGGVDQEAMMKEWMEKYALPGEEHKLLQSRLPRSYREVVKMY